MNRKSWIVSAVCNVGALGCATKPSPASVPEGAEMLFWEWQSWETGGGRNRLTIWKDGHSQIVVVPDAHTRGNPERFRPRQGWRMVEKSSGVTFVREPAFPRDVAREKFTKAFEARIYLLESFRPDYVDGSGTLVGIQIDGKLKETVIPMFLDKNRGTRNHKRFLAMSEILADFDIHAYDLTPQSGANLPASPINQS